MGNGDGSRASASSTSRRVLPSDRGGGNRLLVHAPHGLRKDGVSGCPCPFSPLSRRPFTSLVKLFVDILEATDPIAEAIDRIRFRDFLYHIRTPLSDLLTMKLQVQLDLLQVICTGPTATGLAPAERQASQLLPLIDELQRSVAVLETAVRPEGLRAEIREVCDELRELRFRKLWIARVGAYCGMSAATRKQLLAEIRESAGLVRRCQDSLDKLIDKVARGPDHGNN